MWAAGVGSGSSMLRYRQGAFPREALAAPLALAPGVRSGANLLTAPVAERALVAPPGGEWLEHW